MESRYKKSNDYLVRAMKTIPLGSQTFSKSITQYPKGAAPLFVKKGKGCRIVDIDDNEYIDFVNSLASVTLGYCDEDIDAAVIDQLKNGVSFSLPHILEAEVAEKIVDLVPCAEMVRFGKNGSDATSAAIRLARAYTGKSKIAVCGYHGWQDWYIGSTTRNLGVPEEVKSLTKKFEYNNIDSLEKILNEDKNEFAAIIMEPMNICYPEKGFLEKVREIATKKNIVLIFDETITGFRFAKGGAQELFKVYPDLSTFGKGLANGYPLSAVVGRKNIMLMMEDIFFSGTFAGETLSLSAAKEVLNKINDQSILSSIERMGSYLLEELNKRISLKKVDKYFYTSGHPSWSFLNIKESEEFNVYEAKTLILQEMFQRGIITLGTHNLSYSHTKEDIDELMRAYDEVLPLVADAIDKKNIKERLNCEVLVPLFKVR
jgi:glutamate-1-semialdehyde 2,1-aminomutase